MDEKMFCPNCGAEMKRKSPRLLVCPVCGGMARQVEVDHCESDEDIIRAAIKSIIISDSKS